MNVHSTLDRIEELAHSMVGLPDTDRATTYAAIRTLVRDIEEDNENRKKSGSGYIEEKLRELIWHAQSLAHIDDGNNHTDEQHHLWLLRALHTVKHNTAVN